MKHMVKSDKVSPKINTTLFDSNMDDLFDLKDIYMDKLKEQHKLHLVMIEDILLNIVAYGVPLTRLAVDTGVYSKPGEPFILRYKTRIYLKPSREDILYGI